MAGSGDDAASKERWFMEMFGVDGLFTPARPGLLGQGAVVTNIAHIPAALTEVMALNGVEPDFAPKGDLSLKPWFGNDQGLALPPEPTCRWSRRRRPMTRRSRSCSGRSAAVFIRRSMKDASGATVMDPATR